MRNKPGKEELTPELKQRMDAVLKDVDCILGVKTVLAELKDHLASLKGELEAGDEDGKEKVSLFHARMEANVYHTIRNLENYQAQGWKTLSFKGEVQDDSKA